MRQLGPAALHPSQQALLVSLHPGKTWIGSNTEKMTVTEILLSDEGKLHFDLYVSIYIYLYVCYPEKNGCDRYLSATVSSFADFQVKSSTNRLITPLVASTAA